jgi:molybdenum cofactor cytidylyltransferase
MSGKKMAAIIVAAGFSSRMKAFKPLLKMGSSTIIETALDTFHSVGIRDIVVVTGKNAVELEAHISYSGAICLRSDYTHNKMFDSACIGLNYLKDKCDMAFFTPVDSPLFTKYSLKEMILKMNSSNSSVLCPCYSKEQGHPLLINCNCFEDILSYNGTAGMSGGISRLTDVEMINLPDPALIMDADTPEDYEDMKLYEQERKVPSKEVCLEIHKYFITPQKIQKHCEKVASVAVSTAEALKKKGYSLDVQKIRSASLLHDIVKYKKNHASEGARLLEDLGYTGISPIVQDHMELDEYDTVHVTEKSLVYLADKLVCEDSIISLKERFSKKLKLYQNDKNAYKAVQRRYKQALQVQKIISQRVKEECAYG